MASRIRIEVTEEDIQRAERNSSMRCVIARAIARTFPHAHNIGVDVQTLRWSDDDGRHMYLTPDAAAGYVVAFDAGDPIHPFGFSLNESRRVPVSTRKTNEAGRARAAAAQRVLRQRRNLAEAQSDTQRSDARDALAQAEADQAAVMAEYAGQASTTTTERGRRPPRLAYKTNRRAYGGRMLRINQELQRLREAAGEAPSHL